MSPETIVGNIRICFDRFIGTSQPAHGRPLCTSLCPPVARPASTHTRMHSLTSRHACIHALTRNPTHARPDTLLDSQARQSWINAGGS